MERDHAILSASSSAKWLNCTPSAQLEEAIEDTDTPYSQEGTLAHQFADLEVKLLHGADTRSVDARLEILRMSPFWSVSMEEYAREYAQHVYKGRADFWAVEYKTDFSEYAPEGFGRVDYVRIDDDVLTVVDFKYGKGVPVSAEGNTQTRLYALGVLSELGMLFDIELVEISVIQPRLDMYTSEVLTVEELQEWGDRYVKPRAEKAWAGEGELVTGPWCQFCKNMPTCAAKAAEALEMAKHEFAEPDTLDPVDLADIYEKSKPIISWLNMVESYLYERALNGDEVPGLKLVEGRSNRKWSDQDKVKALLLQWYKEDEITNTKLKGLGDISKLMSKDEFEERLNDYIIKPAGKPVLVPADDPRKALKPAAEAAKIFS